MKKIFKKIKKWFCKILGKFGMWLLKISGNDIYNKPIEIKCVTPKITKLETTITLDKRDYISNWSEEEVHKFLMSDMAALLDSFMMVTHIDEPATCTIKFKGRLDVVNHNDGN